MVVLWDGRSYPFRLQQGDALFISGILPMDRSRKLPFEHVVLAAEARLITNDADLLQLRVYGLPESGARSGGVRPETLESRTGEWWLGKDHIGETIGSAKTVWNLGLRENSMTKQRAAYFGRLLSLLHGSLKFRYASVFAVDPSMATRLETNCLGLVCSFFEYFNLKVLSHDCPSYPSPFEYQTDDRIAPSPGHLAHALRLNSRRHPYKPRTSRQAEKYARADQTLENVMKRKTARRGGRP